MANVGINIMFLGVETLNKKALASVRKNQNLEADQVEKIRKLQNYGMGIIAGLIFGFDEDDESSIDEHIAFMRRTHIPLAGMSVLQAPYGTRLYKKMVHAGRISNDLDAITRSFRTNIILKMNPRAFYKEYARFSSTVYNPEEYFTRCLRWNKTWNDCYVIPGKKGSIPANLNIFRIARSFLLQGVLSPYRLAYWKYLFRVVAGFAPNWNRVALGFYLAYFFRVVYDIKNKIRDFSHNIPPVLIEEWEASGKQNNG
jgi:hypothetical protein